MAILGQMATFIVTGFETMKTKKIQKKRELTCAYFQLKGRQVCSKMYLFSMNIFRKKFLRLKDIYLNNGMVPSVHGGHKNLPKNTTNIEKIQDTVSFLKRYAELNAIYLPGRYPNQKNFSVKLLPSCDNYSALTMYYNELVNLPNSQSIMAALK